MAFRDDSEALRARIEVLENELSDARERIEALADVEVERDRLRQRVAELEREIAKLRPAPSPPKPARAQAPRAVSANRKSNIMLAAGIVAVIGAVVVGLVLIEGGGVEGITSGLDDDAPPSLGMVDLSRTPQPSAIRSDTTGSVAAPGECRGFVPAAPQLVLRTSGSTAVRIAPTSSTDLVLVVRAADGRVLCEDDSDGTNPVVSAVLGRGDHRVWVGTYAENGSATFDLGIVAGPVEAVPDETGLAPDARPALGAWRAPREGGTNVVEGLTRSFADASRVQSSCRGTIAITPDVTFRLDAPMPVSIEATGPADLVLLARTSDGQILCDDDSGPGSAPRLAAELPAGQHAVWVGTFARGNPNVSFQLVTRAYRLDRDAPPALGTHALAGATSMPSLQGSLDADVPPGLLGFAPTCAGLLPSVPSAALSLAGPLDVTLAARSTSATIVAIRHPDGSLVCQSEPLRGTWARGRHLVYVGLAEGAVPAPFELVVQTSSPSVVPFNR